MIDQIRQDLSYALRTLRRNLRFATLVIGGLALGIGANAAIYALVDAVLIRTLPVARPGQLVALGLTENVEASGNGTPGAIMYSYPLYQDVRDANDVFTGVIATGTAGRLDVRVDSTAAEPEHPHTRFVSGNYFALLGVRPDAGRTLGPADNVQGAPPSATLSYAYWTRRFDKDPSIVGRTIVVGDTRVTVTGIASREFEGEVVGTSIDLWLPIAAHDEIMPYRRVLADRTAMWLLLIGRAKPGLTVEQVRARVTPLIERLIRASATPQQLRRLAARRLEIPVASAARGLSAVRATFAAALATLMVAVGLLLSIVCVNVANLLLARGVARRRELALRVALGANRARIVRQLLTESLAIAGLAAAAGVMVAWWASRALVVIASGSDPLALGVDPNASVLLFTLAIAVSSVLLFGLAPALRSSRVDAASAMRSGGRSVATGARFGVSLIAAQVALSLVLVAGASTLVRGVRTALSTDLGLDRDHLVVATLDIESRGYVGSRLAIVVQRLRDGVAAVPGVAGVTLSENGLFNGTEWSTNIDVPSTTPRTSDDSVASTDGVGAGYARGIGAHLIAGRDLTVQDEGPNARSVLVNASFANSYFPGRSAVGRIIRFNPRTDFEIVGVIADVRGQSLDAPVGRRARRIYYPYLHGEDTTVVGQPTALRLLVRTTGDPAPVIGSIRRAIASADGTLGIDRIEPLSSLVRGSIHAERLLMQITTALGLLALVLAAIGQFGVVSYAVARRTNEIGIRMALGARGSEVGRMIVREALRPIAVGVAAGIPLVVVSMRLLRRHLTDVPPADVASVAIAVIVLVACGVVAASLPARRASRINPVEALRQE